MPKEAGFWSRIARKLGLSTVPGSPQVAGTAAVVAGGVITDLNGKAVFPFDLRNYAGAKVPFLAASPAAQAHLLREIATYR